MYEIYCRLYQSIFRYVTRFLPWRRPARLNDYPALAKVLLDKGIKTVLLVTDAGLVHAGLHAELMQVLENNGIRCVLYDKTQPNPTIDNAEEALTLYQREGCAGIVALGGGSPMDCAKAVGARVARPGKSLPKMRGEMKVRKKIPLLIAIPTTAGTGSETTLTSVVTNSSTHEKYAINDLVLIPHYAVLEPRLTLGLPPAVTAGTGMDALCHAVEAYIGLSNTSQTRQDALKATELIYANLLTAFANGQDLDARRNMQEAAFLAGAAFNRAYVGNIHAIAHTISGFYGTPHGLANAIIMPYVLEMYGNTVYKSLSEMAVAAGIADRGAANRENALKFIASIREMNAKMGIPDKFSELRAEDIPTMVKRAMREANPLYPVPVIFNRREMTKVYQRILEV